MNNSQQNLSSISELTKLIKWIENLKCDIRDYGDQEDGGESFTDGFNTAKSKILHRLLKKEGDNH